MKFIDDHLVSTLDLTGLSSRQGVRVIAAVAQALGHPLNTLSISRRTIDRIRKQNRTKSMEKIKGEFSVI